MSDLRSTDVAIFTLDAWDEFSANSAGFVRLLDVMGIVVRVMPSRLAADCAAIVEQSRGRRVLVVK